MSIPSVSSIQFLVNYVRLCWHRWRRLSAPRLWWLWLFTILIHLLLSVSTVAVIVILCLNRLTAPQPLSGAADWAAKTVIEELTGVPASKLNDDRLGRALDAIYPHLEVIWTDIVSRALVRYQIDLSLVFYEWSRSCHGR